MTSNTLTIHYRSLFIPETLSPVETQNTANQKLNTMCIKRSNTLISGYKTLLHAYYPLLCQVTHYITHHCKNNTITYNTLQMKLVNLSYAHDIKGQGISNPHDSY